jgi:hypothetical protein
MTLRHICVNIFHNAVSHFYSYGCVGQVTENTESNVLLGFRREVLILQSILQLQTYGEKVIEAIIRVFYSAVFLKDYLDRSVHRYRECAST